MHSFAARSKTHRNANTDSNPNCKTVRASYCALPVIIEY